MDHLRMQMDKETDQPMSSAGVSKRRVPHFRYQRVGSSNVTKSLDQKGKEHTPNEKTGIIQSQILEGIFDVEKDGNQTFYDIWCEARLPNGQYIRCWPQYRSSEGSRYDWVMMSFDSEDDGGDAMVYPGKVLALYEDGEGNVKA